MVLPLALWAGVAAAGGCGVVDVGALDDGAGPVVLLVETPGFDPAAFRGLVQAAEAEGLGVLALRLPPECHGAAGLVQRDVPRAIASVRDRPAAVVAHAWGATLTVQALASMDPEDHPEALALLGAPLRWEPRALWTALARTMPPHQAWPLRALWRDRPQVDGLDPLGLLLGDDRVPLSRMGASLAQTLATWNDAGHTAPASELPLPVYVAAASLDRLAPVESTRPLLSPSQTFVRYGRLHRMPHEVDHSFLLVDPRPARDLARWVRGALEAP